MYHASNYLDTHELRISRGLNIFDLVAGRANECLLKSWVPSYTWYAESFGCISDIFRLFSVFGPG